MGAQVVAWVTVRAWGRTDEQSDNEEGDNDRNARARDVEAERQRQVIALAEAMGLRRSAEHTQARRRGRDQTR